eukprot:Opistho-2@34546
MGLLRVHLQLRLRCAPFGLLRDRTPLKGTNAEKRRHVVYGRERARIPQLQRRVPWTHEKVPPRMRCPQLSHWCHFNAPVRAHGNALARAQIRLLQVVTVTAGALLLDRKRENRVSIQPLEAFNLRCVNGQFAHDAPRGHVDHLQRPRSRAHRRKSVRILPRRYWRQHGTPKRLHRDPPGCRHVGRVASRRVGSGSVRGEHRGGGYARDRGPQAVQLAAECNAKGCFGRCMRPHITVIEADVEKARLALPPRRRRRPLRHGRLSLTRPRSESFVVRSELPHEKATVGCDSCKTRLVDGVHREPRQFTAAAQAQHVRLAARVVHNVAPRTPLSNRDNTVLVLARDQSWPPRTRKHAHKGRGCAVERNGAHALADAQIHNEDLPWEYQKERVSVRGRVHNLNAVGHVLRRR